MLHSMSSSMIEPNPPKVNSQNILASKQIFFNSLYKTEATPTKKNINELIMAVS